MVNNPLPGDLMENMRYASVTLLLKQNDLPPALLEGEEEGAHMEQLRKMSLTFSNLISCQCSS